MSHRLRFACWAMATLDPKRHYVHTILVKNMALRPGIEGR